jgi:hypothetical protein
VLVDLPMKMLAALFVQRKAADTLGWLRRRRAKFGEAMLQ